MLNDLEFYRLSEEDVAWLDRPFNEDELLGVIQGFNGDKASCPDGFSMAFFQSYWRILKL